MRFIDHPRCIAVIAVTLLTCSAVTARNVAARPKDDPLVEQLNSINGVHVREGDEIRVSALWAEYGRIPGPALDVELIIDGEALRHFKGQNHP